MIVNDELETIWRQKLRGQFLKFCPTVRMGRLGEPTRAAGEVPNMKQEPLHRDFRYLGEPVFLLVILLRRHS
jgi:hypothetical protein